MLGVDFLLFSYKRFCSINFGKWDEIVHFHIIIKLNFLNFRIRLFQYDVGRGWCGRRSSSYYHCGCCCLRQTVSLFFNVAQCSLASVRSVKETHKQLCFTSLYITPFFVRMQSLTNINPWFWVLAIVFPVYYFPRIHSPVVLSSRAIA